MSLRPTLLALAVLASLAACQKNDADTAATPAATPAPTVEPAVAAPPPPSRVRGQAIMGKDGYGLTVCGMDQQRIVGFAPEVQPTLDKFLAGGAHEFFLDAWAVDGADGKPQVIRIERIYTEGPGCDEKDIALSLFRARGNEPFWAVDVTPSGVTLERPDVDKLTMEYQPLEQTADGGRRFAADTPEGKFELTLVPGTCSDGMSDTVYGWNATATIGEQNFKGCAFSGLTSE